MSHSCVPQCVCEIVWVWVPVLALLSSVTLSKLLPIPVPLFQNPFSKDDARVLTDGCLWIWNTCEIWHLSICMQYFEKLSRLSMYGFVLIYYLVCYSTTGSDLNSLFLIIIFFAGNLCTSGFISIMIFLSLYIWLALIIIQLYMSPFHLSYLITLSISK